MLNENDLAFLSSLGITNEEVYSQIDYLEGKIPNKSLTLIRPCTYNDGILSPDEVKRINSESNPVIPDVFISRFIPSSGSASRMFRFDKFTDKDLDKIHLLPFFLDIQNYCLDNNIDLKKIILDKDVDRLKDIFINDDKMDLSSIPKGLINFHKIGEYFISPFEEFIINSFEDITNSNIFFTIQDEFRNNFVSKIDNSSFINKEDIKDSYQLLSQSKSSESICLDKENKIVRDKNGNIYTHPSGHGALLEVLNKVDADFIFINNIDNISPKTRDLRYQVSRSLFNIALYTKRNFDIMIQTFIERNYKLLEPLIAQLENVLPPEFKSKKVEEKIDIVIDMLNKPVRVCGVVKDENSTGGKPFWVFDGNSESVQIVEEAQVDFSNESQKNLWKSSTYFNPVEMICCTKDFKGDKFDFKNYSNNSLRMNIQKNIKGVDCNFIELPGLWNGSMHYWHTTFVEIPSSLFTPVKYFTDLFLPIHQP